MSVCTTREHRVIPTPILDLDDQIYIYENFFMGVVTYTVVAVIRDKDGITYRLDAYDEDGDLINYRSITEDQIGKTAYLDRKMAENSNNE